MTNKDLLISKVRENIKFYRKKANLSHKEVAEKSRKSSAWFTSIENGRITPTLSVLYDFAELFDCSIYDLIPDNKAKKITENITGNVESLNLQLQVIKALDE